MAAHSATPEALRGQGVDAWERGDAAAALALLRESLAAFRHSNDVAGSARALNDLATIAQLQERYADARTYCLEGLPLATRAEDQPLEAALLRTLADVARQDGDRAAALQYYERCAGIFERMNDPGNCAAAVAWMGMLAWEAHDLAVVVQHFERAVALYRQAEDAKDTGRALLNLSMAMAELGDGAEAESLRAEAAALFASVDDAEDLALAEQAPDDSASQEDDAIAPPRTQVIEAGYATIFGSVERAITADLLRQFTGVLQVDVSRFLGKTTQIRVALAQCGITLDVVPAKRLRSYLLPQTLAHLEQTAAGGLTPAMRDRVLATHLVLGVKVEPCHDRGGQSKAFIRALTGHFDGFFCADDAYYTPSGALLAGSRHAQPY